MLYIFALLLLFMNKIYILWWYWGRNQVPVFVTVGFFFPFFLFILCWRSNTPTFRFFFDTLSALNVVRTVIRDLSGDLSGFQLLSCVVLGDFQVCGGWFGAVSSEADRNNNYSPAADALLLLHLLPRYSLIQTIFTWPLTRLYCVVLEVRKKKKMLDDDLPGSLETTSLWWQVVGEAWENLLQQKRKKQSKLQICRSAGSLFKNTIVIPGYS